MRHLPPRRVRRSLALAAAAVLGLTAVAACGTIPPQLGAGSSPSAGSSASPGAGSAASATPGAEPSDGGDAPAAEVCDYTPSGTAARKVQLPSTAGVPTTGVVTVTLAMSDEMTVKFTMDRSKAPCTVHSFESLAAQGYFDKTRCHRLADRSIFVLQCGDPTATGSGGPGYTFANETDGTESYTAGVVAMANAGPNTNGSQFFLVYEDSTALDTSPDYTIFGTLDATSLGVVNRIAAEGQDGSNPDGSGKPNNPAEIIKASLSAAQAAG